MPDLVHGLLFVVHRIKKLTNNHQLLIIHRKAKGFTLIELLVVMTIMSLLAGIIVMSTNNTRDKGKDARRKQDLQAISSALVAYYVDHHFFPATTSGDGSLKLDYSSGEQANWIPSLSPQYIKKLPKDPLQASITNITNLASNTVNLGKNFLSGIFSHDVYANIQPSTCNTSLGSGGGSVYALNAPNPLLNGSTVNFQVGYVYSATPNGDGCDVFNIEVFMKLPGQSDFSTTPVCTIAGPVHDGQTANCPSLIPYTVDTANFVNNQARVYIRIMGDKHDRLSDCTIPHNPNSGTSACTDSQLTSLLILGTPPVDLPGGYDVGVTPGACNNSTLIYCYRVSENRKNFILWTQLENTNDPELYNSPKDVAACNDNDLTIMPPTGSSLNYCIRSPR